MLEKLIKQMHWANALSIAWLKANPDADPIFHKLTSHVLNAEGIWMARIRGEALDTDILRLIPFAELTQRNDKNHAAYIDQRPGDVARMVDYRMLNGEPGRTAVEDIILHVTTHGHHHRGQMASKASSLGLKYPNVAYVQYTRVKPPA